MRASAIALLFTVAIAAPLAAQEAREAEVFAAALNGVLHELRVAPPVNPKYPRDLHDLPADAIAVARKTIGGAPQGYRSFVDKWFGQVIAEELLEAYGDAGPATKKIEQETASRFRVLPLEEFEAGEFDYDWHRLNQFYPDVRYVVRLSWPALDRVGTYAVVRYELIARDRPATIRAARKAWQWGAFVEYEKQADGSWTRGTGVVGNLWE